jgi:hypothetical protein
VDEYNALATESVKASSTIDAQRKQLVTVEKVVGDVLAKLENIGDTTSEAVDAMGKAVKQIAEVVSQPPAVESWSPPTVPSPELVEARHKQKSLERTIQTLRSEAAAL